MNIQLMSLAMTSRITMQMKNAQQNELLTSEEIAFSTPLQS